MTEVSTTTNPKFSLYTYYRHTGSDAKSTIRRQLLIKESDDPIELLDLARELVRLHLVYEVFLTLREPTKETDDGLLASWAQLAVEALKEKGPLETRLLA